MSYSLIGHFVDVNNKKVIVSAELGFMKNLNSRRYSADFEEIDSTSKTKMEDYSEITTYIYTDFQGYYKKDILEDPFFKQMFTVKNNTFRNGEPGYVFDKDFIEKHKEDFEKYSMSPSLEDLVNKSDELKEKAVIVYYRETKETSGIWYSMKDFEDAVPNIRKEYEEVKARLAKLEGMKDTYEWFKLDENAQNNILEEIGWVKEEVEDKEWKYDSIVKMTNILDFIKHDVGFKYVDEDGSTKYNWYYDDNREIDVFIEVD
jgi:hypothetical protein